MTTISEIIDRKGGMVLSVDGNDSVFDAICLMAEVNVGAVLVKEKDTIAGIFTERDYLQKIALNSRSSRNTAVKEAMSSPVITAEPDDSIQQCMETMTSCRCRHLPVVEDGELLGIVSIGDLVKRLLEEKETEVAQLSQYISGSY
ncbi:MAG: CBS domain-containing protein [Xanthomonadales bacterium]|nr:CBS domain-containing protein [Xanthomonadales bacterium]NIQ97311.1 CBS domain-containing protein [Desulfuromonadales bacterium]NIX12162.1 CBS domain-containing protein [Xanthomonadales bacterium]